MELNEKLVGLRRQRGMTQAELAQVLDVTRQALSKWERGEGKPSTENLIAVGKLFSVSIDALADDSLDLPEVAPVSADAAAAEKEVQEEPLQEAAQVQEETDVQEAAQAQEETDVQAEDGKKRRRRRGLAKLAIILGAALLAAALIAVVYPKNTLCPMHCGGYLLTHPRKVGEPRYLGLQPCNLYERFNCRVYEVSYQDVTECNNSVCGYIDEVTRVYTKTEFHHDHSAGVNS